MGWKEITKTHDLAVSERMLSDVLTLRRFDAEYFQPEYLEYDECLSKKSAQSISNLVTIADGNHLGISQYFTEDENGIPYYRGQDVNNFFLEASNPLKIPEEIYAKGWMRRSYFQPNDILLSIVGTVGSLSFVTDKLGKATGSCKIAILRPKDVSETKPLVTFLLSKYGQYQLKRMTRGAVQTGIILEDIPFISVPVIPNELKEKITLIVDKAIEVERSARLAFSEAEKLLLKEINLEGYVPSEKNTSVRELAECLADNRFDAEYWEPRFDEMKERVSSIPQQELGDIVSIEKGIDPGSEAYTESGKSFVRVSDISIYGIEDGDKKISDELYAELKDDYKPQKGEVLFTKDGTIGISFALHEDIDAIVSSAFLRLKPKIKINIDYLTLVLNSLYCKFQIERMSGGAIIAHLKPESVKKIKVPVLSDAKQEELAEKAVSSLRLRNEAKELLEKAKRAVEIFIEKDEQEALKYLASGKSI